MRPTAVKIDLNALRKNLGVVRKIVGDSVGVIPVVKADAYGHGAVAIAWVLAESGIDMMAVACIEEAMDLVEAGVPSRFLMLGGIGDEKGSLEVPPNCVPVVWDIEGIRTAASLPSSVGRPIEIHLKVNTGMFRLGCEASEVAGLMEEAKQLAQVRITGVMSHMASADCLEKEEIEFSREQAKHFRDISKTFPKGTLAHMAASAGLMRYPEARFSAVRPGIMLYGIWPFEGKVDGLPVGPKDLTPVLSLTTAVTQIRSLAKGESVSYSRKFVASRPSKIAVLPVGYADGVNRKLSNKGEVLIGGVRRKITGNVTMDFIMVDVTDNPPVNVGDEAVIIGHQGSDEITAWDHARWAETIPYEITCSIGKRVPRMAIDEI